MRNARPAHLALPPLAALALLWAACTPGERPAQHPTASPAEAGLAREVCAAGCARTIRCEGPKGAVCACDGLTDTGLLRADWVRAEIACLGRTACDAPDPCEDVAYRAIGASPLSWPPVVMRCFQRGATCGASAASCRRLAAMSDAAQAEAATCFDKSCDEYAACFRSFFASRVAPAVPAWR